MPASRSVHAHGKSELKARPAVLRALVAERRRLGASLRSSRERSGLTQEEAAERIGLHVKHLQRLERGNANATLATLVACALAFGVSLPALLAGLPAVPEPFERIEPETATPSRNAIPLVSLRAVAGKWGALQQVHPEAWVRLPGRARPAAGLFIAQVIGESMNRRIPNGSYCVFRAPAAEPLNGKVVLAQHRGETDPEQGGRYTVKRYRATAREIRLEPISLAARYRPLIFRGLDRADLRVLAELIQVLGTSPG